MKGFIVASCLAVQLSLSGCDNACDALADKICSCELELFSRNEETACVQAVDSARRREVTETELALCESRLDTCTCLAIENPAGMTTLDDGTVISNLSACALAK